MTFEVQKPLEWAFIEPKLANLEFYKVNSCHTAHSSGGTNEFPLIRFRMDELLWNHDLPDDSRLEGMIWERWGEDWDFICEDFKQKYGFNIMTDCRGYLILAEVKLYELWENREENQEEINEMFTKGRYDKDEFDELKENIEEFDQELMIAGKQTIQFIEWAKGFVDGMKSHFDDHIVIVDNEGFYDFVDKEWFYELLEQEPERGWQDWTQLNKDKEVAKDKVIDFQERSVRRAIGLAGRGLLTKITESWKRRAVQSMI